MAVNNRKRKAADSAEILEDGPDRGRDDRSRGEGGKAGAGVGRAEKGKCDGAVLRVIDRVAAKIR